MEGARDDLKGRLRHLKVDKTGQLPDFKSTVCPDVNPIDIFPEVEGAIILVEKFIAEELPDHFLI